MKFYEMLKEHMDENELTQRDVANELGCSQVMVSKYLSGLSVPERPAITMKAAVFLGVELDKLLTVISDGVKEK